MTATEFASFVAFFMYVIAVCLRAVVGKHVRRLRLWYWASVPLGAILAYNQFRIAFGHDALSQWTLSTLRVMVVPLVWIWPAAIKRPRDD